MSHYISANIDSFPVPGNSCSLIALKRGTGSNNDVGAGKFLSNSRVHALGIPKLHRSFVTSCHCGGGFGLLWSLYCRQFYKNCLGSVCREYCSNAGKSFLQVRISPSRSSGFITQRIKRSQIRGTADKDFRIFHTTDDKLTLNLTLSPIPSWACLLNTE